MTTRERSRPALILFLAAAAVLALGLVWGLGSAVAASDGPSPASGKVVYRVGILVEPDNLNPFIGFMWLSYEVWYLTYEPLVGYDYATLGLAKGGAAGGREAASRRPRYSSNVTSLRSSTTTSAPC